MARPFLIGSKGEVRCSSEESDCVAYTDSTSDLWSKVLDEGEMIAVKFVRQVVSEESKYVSIF